MPRPGPRPYECVRRAWHSDAHQPLRGTLIQEILRVVTESHKPETRRKNEWQEKLPTVVLRAEEILYSKAKSEAEYMDVKTLRERLGDAVDTMIRRTDASREDPYMQPCVEAALSLCCYPKNFPRGQRLGARHSGIAKRVASALSGASSGSSTGGSPSQQNQSSFLAHAKRDPCRRDNELFSKTSLMCLPGESFLPSSVSELPILGARNPSLLRPAYYCPEPRSALHRGHHLNSSDTKSGFAAPKREEHCPNRADFRQRVKLTQDSQAIARLPVPNAVELATRYPSICLSSHNSTDPASKCFNASPYNSSLHGSHGLQPPANSESTKSCNGSLRFATAMSADASRQMEAPVASLVKDARSVALTSYSSPGSKSANPVSCKGKMQPSLPSQFRCSTPGDSAESVLRGLGNEPKEALSLTRVQSPAEKSTAASPIPVLDDLRLSLALPGRILSSSAISQGFTNRDSCGTHLPSQLSKEARKFTKPSLEGNPEDAKVQNAFPSDFDASSKMIPDSRPLGAKYLNEKFASKANEMEIPAMKRQRWYTQAFSTNARSSGQAKESCDLQIGLHLQVKR